MKIKLETSLCFNASPGFGPFHPSIGVIFSADDLLVSNHRSAFGRFHWHILRRWANVSQDPYTPQIQGFVYAFGLLSSAEVAEVFRPDSKEIYGNFRLIKAGRKMRAFGSLFF